MPETTFDSPPTSEIIFHILSNEIINLSHSGLAFVKCNLIQIHSGQILMKIFFLASILSSLYEFVTSQFHLLFRSF